jgi:polyhydroxybutyrate depolymerase
MFGPADRRAELVAPATMTEPAPLVLALHGYGRTPAEVDRLLHITESAAARGMYVLFPTGTEDRLGMGYWNASAACCDFFDSEVDDVDYLDALLGEVMAARPVDPDRVYVVGHSNGGFMAYRLACELADVVAAVAVLGAGDAAADGGCVPARPVSVLHLHGDADGRVPYAGGVQIEAHPGAVETVQLWADRNGCTGDVVDLDPVDLMDRQEGPETAITAYEGCPSGVDVWLGTIARGPHEPVLSADAVGESVFDWLLAHGR